MTDNRFNIVVDVESTGSEDLTNLGQKTKNLEGELKKLSQVESLKKLAADMRQTGTAYGDAQKNLDALTREMETTENPTKQLTREYSRAQKEVSLLASNHGKATKAFYTMRNSLRSSGVDTKQLTHEQLRLKEGVKALTTQVTQYKREVQAGANLNYEKGLLGVDKYISNRSQVKYSYN